MWTDQNSDEGGRPGVYPENALLVIPSFSEGSDSPPHEISSHQKKRAGPLVGGAGGPKEHVQASANLKFPLGREAPCSSGEAPYMTGVEIALSGRSSGIHKSLFLRWGRTDGGVSATRKPSVEFRSQRARGNRKMGNVSIAESDGCPNCPPASQLRATAGELG